MEKHKRACTRLQNYRADYGLYYKEALRKLLERRDLESVLYLRIAMETGIRSQDILLLNESCIIGRYVRMFSSKNGDCYFRMDGKLPLISQHTKRIMEALIRKQGKFFTKPFRYYYLKIRRAWPDAEFSLHMLRQIWLRRNVEIVRLEIKTVMNSYQNFY